ncbi:MAG TPA: hypothetical protein VF756_04320 [Thermoanaerobaculia bacterium]
MVIKKKDKDKDKGSQPTEGIERHRKYLAEVPREVETQRLGVFRKKIEDVHPVPIICYLGEISNKFRQFHPYVHPLDPVSLDDLKNWVGVPNEVARKQMVRSSTAMGSGRACSMLQDVCVHHLPAARSFEFEKLEPEQRLAVRQTANNLLYGYVDEEEARRAPYAGVIEYMLERARAVPGFFAKDLIVCPGDKVNFSGFSVLHFNNILVYGDGQIFPGNNTKVHAFQIRHVPA